MLLLVPWAVRSRSSMPLFINEDEAWEEEEGWCRCGWPAVPEVFKERVFEVEFEFDVEFDVGVGNGELLLFCGVCRRRCMERSEKAVKAVEGEQVEERRDSARRSFVSGALGALGAVIVHAKYS